MKTVLPILLSLAIAIPVTWFVTTKFHSNQAHSASTSAQAAKGQRKLLYFQCAMHPWIKSDKPGRCTICGMELTPVYEGEAGFDSAGGGDIVPLTQSMIQVLHVQTSEVLSRPLKKTLQVAGMVDDNQTRHRVLSAYIPGRVEKLYVNYLGAEVEAGQPLAEFYSPSLLQSEREYRALSGELRSATALRLRQMGLTPGQIEQLPKKQGDTLTSQILSPIGGTVVAQTVYEGQYVQEGERLFEIADFSTMWFQFRAYEQDLPWIKLGLKVDITTPSHPGKTFSGNITFIDPNFDETTRSTKVRVELANPLVEGHRLLLHRLYADGKVHLESPQVVAVPRSAILETGPEALAYVDQGGGAYARRVVQLGQRGDQDIEVKSGLVAGEKVVVNGNLLIDGQAEMNRSFASVKEKPSTTPAVLAAKPALPALTDAERKAMKDFLVAVDAITTALAADDLQAFNAQTEKTHSVTSTLLSAFPANSPWHAILKPFESVGHLKSVPDLKEARKAFYPLSKASALLTQSVRRSDPAFATWKVFRCPMTKNAFPGAPAIAEWIQGQSIVRNPYFGNEMPDCGSEVKN